MNDRPMTHKFPRNGVLAALAIGLAARLLHAWTYYGWKYDDEHWQVMEPANGLVHGFWHRTVEWQEGLRSWIYPWLVSWLIRLAEALGLKDAIFIASFIRSAHGVLSLVGVTAAAILTWRWCQANSAARPFARGATLATAWWLALLPYSVYMGAHCHGESVGAVFLVCALLAMQMERAVLAGLLFGGALAIKIDLAVLGLMAGLWYLGTRRVGEALKLAVGVVGPVLLVGLVDKLTGGTWFQNVLGHARVNLVEEIGNQWGVSPWYQHILFVLSMGGLPLLSALALLPTAWKGLSRELKTAWIVMAGFVAVFSYVEHKEKRFMTPLLYLSAAAACATCAAGAPAVGAWARRHPLGLKAVAAAAAAGVTLHLATEVRNYITERPWHERVLALRAGGLATGVEKFVSCQWPANFYFPRHIPAVNAACTRENITKMAKGIRAISVVHDGPHIGWWEEEGFKCAPWPHPRRQSKDPVPAAWRCERTL